MQKINWTTYIAANNPEGVNQVLEKYGYLRTMSDDEFPEAIDLLQEEKGINATIDLIKQHPDFDIIVDTYNQDQPVKNATGNDYGPVNQQPQNYQQPLQVHSDVPNITFASTLQNVVLVVMAFWLINKIISK